jgi:hypothetical protein
VASAGTAAGSGQLSSGKSTAKEAQKSPMNRQAEGKVQVVFVFRRAPALGADAAATAAGVPAATAAPPSAPAESAPAKPQP